MTMAPRLVEVDVVDSTQQVAAALWRADYDVEHGATVVARAQTGGRGRRGRSWSSSHHGAWVSVIVRRPLPLLLAPRLGLVVAAHVVGALDAAGIATFIKWPNDLLIQTPRSLAVPSTLLGPFRKVGGLIIEVLRTSGVGAAGEGALGHVVDTCIMGVGINIAAPNDDELVHAGGLDEVAQGAFAGDDGRLALARLIQEAVVSADVDDDAFAAARAVCRARSATLGRRVMVDGVVGVAEDINDDGSLAIRGADDVVSAVSAGDVVVV